VDDILRELDGYDHSEIETNPTPYSADHERWTATKVSGPDDYRLFTLHLNQPQMQAVMDACSGRFRTSPHLKLSHVSAAYWVLKMSPESGFVGSICFVCSPDEGIGRRRT
jgi:hypothetical protein